MLIRPFTVRRLILAASICAAALRMTTSVIARFDGSRSNAGQDLFSSLLLPLLLYAASDWVCDLRSDWAANKWIKPGALGLALSLIAIRLATLCTGWQPPKMLSFLFHLPLISIITLAFLIAFGLVMLRKTGWPWLALGALGFFLGIAAPVKFFGPDLRAIAEILFSICLLMTERRVRTRTFNEHHNPDLH